jgi:adenine-specific DNA-methyltransferase
VFSGVSEWTETRIKQLQTLKDIAFKIIAFISQFENELVKIWSKPKFVLNSNYVITLDRIAEKDIALVQKLLTHENFEAQVEEWQQLGIVDDSFKTTAVLEKQGRSQCLAKSFQYLPIDIKHFKDLELKILGLFDNLDAALDGWLIKSENYQALNTLMPKIGERVHTIYADPPYNVGPSEIPYVNNFKHSSWLTMMTNRLALAKSVLRKEGILCITIDHIELHRLRSLVEEIFNDELILGLVCIKNNPSGRSTVKGFSVASEYAIFVGSSGEASIGTVPRTEEQMSQYDQADELGKFQWRNFMRSGGANDLRQARPRLHYPLFISKDSVRIPKMEWDGQAKSWVPQERPRSGEQAAYPKSSEGTEYTWRLGVESLTRRIHDLRLRDSKDGKRIVEIRFRADEEGVLPKTIWDNKLFNATAYGTSLLGDIMGSTQYFSFPKSVHAVEECIRVCNIGSDGFVLDFFGGSGTTSHAVINMNRQDGGRRRYVLVEMAEYFDTVLLPRIKKVVFSNKWKDGKTAGGEGMSHFLKYCALEQYEDVLRRAKYGDADLFDDPNKDPYHQYVFLRDLKMLEALEVDTIKNKVKVDLSKLYDGIDIAETLSNLTGKWIKRITADPSNPLRAGSVEFDDGEVVDTKNLDWKRIKPLIWW